MPDKIDAFLKKAGFEDYQRQLMTPDASYRRYERIVSQEGSYVLMIVPVDHPLEDGQSGIEGVLKPFLEIREYLEESGFRVPRALFSELDSGLLLLEDLGEETLYSLCTFGHGEQRKWYATATYNLVQLAETAPKPELPRINEELMLLRGKFFLDDYFPLVTGEEAPKESYEELRSILSQLYKDFINVPWGTVLWDYHSPNLMPLSDEPKNMNSLAIIDFQDAKVGPLTYDLACLLYDARLPVSSRLREELLQSYLTSLPHLDRDAFIVSFAIAGLFRNIGVLGRLARLARRDNRDEYKKFLPKVRGYIDEGCTLSQASELRGFLKKYKLKQTAVGRLLGK